MNKIKVAHYRKTNGKHPGRKKMIERNSVDQFLRREQPATAAAPLPGDGTQGVEDMAGQIVSDLLSNLAKALHLAADKISKLAPATRA
jgi:hypothetical protein